MGKEQGSAAASASGGAPPAPQAASKWVTHLLPTLFLRLLIFSAVSIPYNKVEESFYTQAIHDMIFTLRSVPSLLHQGVSLVWPQTGGLQGTSPLTFVFADFDHTIFGAVVPRSSLPAFVLGALTRCLRLLFSFFGAEELTYLTQKLYGEGGGKLLYFVIARSFLAVAYWWAIKRIRGKIQLYYGLLPSVLFLVTCMTQPHVLLYASRPMPNTIALIPFMWAFPYYIDLLQPHQPSRVVETALKQWVTWIIPTALILRSEVGACAACFFLPLLYTFGMRKLTTLLWKRVLLTIALSLLATVLVDSWFWQTPLLWPEGTVFWFNTYLNKSVEWGVEPIHTYFTKHLPKALLAAYPLALLESFGGPRRHTSLLLSSIAFVMVMSGLGHKETRFVWYTIPGFNMLSSLTLARWLRSSDPQKVSLLSQRIRQIMALGLLALSLFYTTTAYMAASSNYPGGLALRRTNELLLEHHRLHPTIAKSRSYRVCIGNEPSQTGISRFAELLSSTLPVEYDRFCLVNAQSWHAVSGDFDYVVGGIEDEDMVAAARAYQLVDTIDGYAGLEKTPDWPLTARFWKPLRMQMTPKAFIYQNKKL